MFGKKLIKISLLGLVITLLSFNVLAVYGVPHQFYGAVIIDGSPAPDDLVVEARIENDIYSSPTRNGVYGFDSLFYVEDPNSDREGKTITFFVDTGDGNMVETLSRTFSNGAVTRINLIVSSASQSVAPPSSSTSSSSRGSRSSSSGGVVVSNPDVSEVNNSDNSNNSVNNSVVSNSVVPVSVNSGSGLFDTCEPEWVCSEWSECVDFEQVRVCVDANDCGLVNGPALTRSCNLNESNVNSQRSGLTGLVTGIGDATSSWFGFIILVLVIGLLFFLILFRRFK